MTVEASSATGDGSINQHPYRGNLIRKENLCHLVQTASKRAQSVVLGAGLAWAAKTGITIQEYLTPAKEKGMDITYYLLVTALLTFFISSHGMVDRAAVSGRSRRLSSPRYFKQQDQPEDGGGEQNRGFTVSNVLRFISSKFKSGEPQTSTGMRYELRLVRDRETSVANRRHITTRLLRYFPDLSWQTATVIVDTCLDQDKSLVRVFNDLSEASYFSDMLKKADPPIKSEIYDSKKGEIL